MTVTWCSRAIRRGRPTDAKDPGPWFGFSMPTPSPGCLARVTLMMHIRPSYGGIPPVDTVSSWKPWLPPTSDQGLQQGGAFVFEGEELLFQHYDPSTGAHVDLDTVLKVALTA